MDSSVLSFDLGTIYVMNNLVKKLAEQAGWRKGEQWSDCMTCGTFDIEQFATLIVEECRSINNEVYQEVPLESCGYFIHLDEKILEHFYGDDEHERTN